MQILYNSDREIHIDNAVLIFGENRKKIRSRLIAEYKEDNQVIDLKLLNGEVLHKRRDIYNNLILNDTFFFIGYNQDDLFRDIEVHNCNVITVFDISFSFNDDIDSIAERLKMYNSKTISSDGEYFFEDLKIVIMNKEQMGGEGNTLGYFYCSSDVGHLHDYYLSNTGVGL